MFRRETKNLELSFSSSITASRFNRISRRLLWKCFLFDVKCSVSWIYTDANRRSIPAVGSSALISWYIFTWTITAGLYFQGPGPRGTNLARTEAIASALLYMRMFFRKCLTSPEFKVKSSRSNARGSAKDGIIFDSKGPQEMHDSTGLG